MEETKAHLNQSLPVTRPTSRFLVIAALALMVFSATISHLQAAVELKCEAPRPRSCSFYIDCIEENFHCGNSGYPVDYGNRYCEIFKDLDTELTEKGRQWRDSTMLCLQETLLEQIITSSRPRIGCQQIESWGFGSHAPCYTQEGRSICFLDPIRDLPTIISAIDHEDLINRRARRQTIDVAKICVSQVRSRLPFFGWGDRGLTQSNHSQLLLFWQSVAQEK
jgi:hypothetical protein